MDNNNGLGFLFKKSNLPKWDLNFLVSDMTFCEKFINNKEYNTGIDLDKEIYKIVCEIFFEIEPFFCESFFSVNKFNYKEKYGSKKYKEFLYRHKGYKNVINSLSKLLFNDSSAWKKDYEKYLREGETNE